MARRMVFGISCCLVLVGDSEWDEGPMIRAGTRSSLRWRVVRGEQGRRRRSRWVGDVFAHAGTGSPCEGEAISCSV